MAFVVTLTGPTTSGKTTLLRRLQSINPNVVELISHTTRAPREGEIDGKTYYFCNQKQFDKVEFVERISFNGKNYGLSRKEVENRLNDAGIIPIVIMEPHGVGILEDYLRGTDFQMKHRIYKIFVDIPEQVAAQRMIERIQASKDATYSANRMVSLMKTELPQWPKTHEWDLKIDEYNVANAEALPLYLSAFLETLRIANNSNLVVNMKGRIGDTFKAYRHEPEKADGETHIS